MNVTLTKEEAQQVLEYVECVPDDRLNVEHIDRDALVETLRARLAEPPERVTKEMLQAQVNALIALQKIQDSRHEREARLAEPEKKQEPVAWNKSIRDSVDSLLAQAGFELDSSVRHQLAMMNFESTTVPLKNWRNAIPGGRHTDQWESCRVADYNKGWNEYRKAAKAALEKLEVAPPPPQQKEQEPVAWYLPSDEGFDSLFRDHRTVVACTGNKWEGWQPLYAAPPQRPWVGLTDEEIKGVLETTHPENRWTIAERIEAKLKEKNSV